MKINKIPSFNLQEMLIVLAIIGILLLIALPNLMPVISKAKSVEAQVQLKAIYNAEKQHFFMHSKYSNDLGEIDFESPKSVKQNGSANYTYEIIQSNSSEFVARATSVTDFDGDGIFNVWEINQEGNPIQITND